GPSASTLVAAGIFGGIVALALAGSMQYAGYLPAAAPSQDSSADIQALRQEVEALREAPASSPAPAPDPELASRLDALETAVAQRADDSGIEERLASLEQQLQSVQSASQGTASENSARLDELQRR